MPDSFKSIKSPQTQQISKTLLAVFPQIDVDIIDKSHLHKGHGGYKEGISTHFCIIINKQSFKEGENISRIQCDQKIYASLSNELDDFIHALEIKWV